MTLPDPEASGPLDFLPNNTIKARVCSGLLKEFQRVVFSLIRIRMGGLSHGATPIGIFRTMHVRNPLKALKYVLLLTSLTLVCAILVTATTNRPARAEPMSLTVGVVPQFEARRLAEIWDPILARVSEQTGIQLSMVGSTDIPTFEADFLAGAFDLAYMNPYHALMADEAQGYIPIIRDGGRQLFGILAVSKYSPVESVADLEGQVIAFPAPNALGAALLMRADLDRRFGLNFQPSYVATHSSAYLNAAIGEAAAAGGVMATFRRLDTSISDQLRVLYETTRVPPHPVVAHPRIPEDIRQKLQSAFLDVAATEEGAALLAKIPMRAAIPTSAADYDIVRDLELDTYMVDPSQIVRQ